MFSIMKEQPIFDSNQSVLNEAAGMLENSYFNNSFDFVRQFKNGSF